MPEAPLPPSPELPTKVIIKAGTEQVTPKVGDKVHIHYVGTLNDGSKFDSSRDRGKPFITEIGMSKVIKAWDMLVPTMNLGEIAKFTCPPAYAYGSRGFPGLIPPNSPLTFEVELIGINDRMKKPE